MSISCRRSRRLDRLYDVIETGHASLEDKGSRIRELKERYRKLQARKEELQLRVPEQTAELPTQEEVTECAADLRSSLEQLKRRHSFGVL